ncbi:MAG: nucleotide sugar dehydrogenase [Planctomycetota bacterium]|nr:MAG: nucleotide sugar dehydrogenase [Planctomycetota bacterium]
MAVGAGASLHVEFDVGGRGRRAGGSHVGRSLSRGVASLSVRSDASRRRSGARLDREAFPRPPACGDTVCTAWGCGNRHASGRRERALLPARVAGATLAQHGTGAAEASTVAGEKHAEAWLGRLRTRDVPVGVIGLGYVGLPLAVAFADAGFPVVGIDTDRDKVGRISRGHREVDDIDAAQWQRVLAAGRLRASTSYEPVRDVGVVVICVPTPLRKTREPDLTCVLQAVAEIAPRLREGSLVVLESTAYPGATEELICRQLEQRGWTVGRDVFVAFSPERVDPGNREFGIANTPKVVGGATPRCRQLAAALYETITRRVVGVSSLRAAEMVKLLENTYRAVNIGLANEMACICHRLGVDVWEVIEAAATKPFGFAPFYPGPGLGGHCIPVDPLYLSWRMRALRYEARFIGVADAVNRSMPQYCIGRIIELLNDAGRPVRGSRLLLLGMAYKRDTSDVRESAAIDVAAGLLRLGAVLEYADPHVPRCVVGSRRLEAVEPDADRLAKADLVVVLVDHAAFDRSAIARHARRVFDTRNLLRGIEGDHIERL